MEIKVTMIAQIEVEKVVNFPDGAISFDASEVMKYALRTEQVSVGDAKVLNIDLLHANEVE